MISTPDYWLAPVLVALAAWINNNRDLAERAIREAVKRDNEHTSLAMALILAGILAARFDFYYDLNDDVLIKDILSGVYSGTPDGHTMQLLYPLGALLALLYRGLSIPVFGAFLLFCQFGSIWAVGYRSTVLVDEERAARDGAPFAPGMCSAASAARLAEPAVCSAWNTTAARLGVKGVLLLAEALFWFAAMGSHLVYLQYTVTAGMLRKAAQSSGSGLPHTVETIIL